MMLEKLKRVLHYPKNIRYLLDGKQNASYAESELKLANNAKYIVKKILDKKSENRVIYYLIWWKNYPKNRSTWEPKSNLIKNGLKDLINEYKNTRIQEVAIRDLKFKK